MTKSKKQITKENYNKKILALLLAGSISLGLSGCGKQQERKLSFLENTLLEETFVADTDLGIIIAKKYGAPLSEHEHYMDVVSGLEFGNKKIVNNTNAKFIN